MPMHTRRRWVVVPAQSAPRLAEKLVNHSWCSLAGWSLGGCLFLNDQTSPDGAFEVAVVKPPPSLGACGGRSRASLSGGSAARWSSLSTSARRASTRRPSSSPGSTSTIVSPGRSTPAGPGEWPGSSRVSTSRHPSSTDAASTAPDVGRGFPLVPARRRTPPGVVPIGVRLGQSHGD